jgi:hypothetical protein
MSKTTTNSTVRTELNKYAQQIESLAKQVQTTLTAGGNPLTVAHELVRNSSTFVFVLGEMYALEAAGKTKTSRKANKTTTATVVSNPNNTPVGTGAAWGTASTTATAATTATTTATTTPNYRHSKRDQSTGRFLRN